MTIIERLEADIESLRQLIGLKSDWTPELWKQAMEIIIPVITEGEARGILGIAGHQGLFTGPSIPDILDDLRMFPTKPAHGGV